MHRLLHSTAWQKIDFEGELGGEGPSERGQHKEQLPCAWQGWLLSADVVMPFLWSTDLSGCSGPFPTACVCICVPKGSFQPPS